MSMKVVALLNLQGFGILRMQSTVTFAFIIYVCRWWCKTSLAEPEVSLTWSRKCTENVEDDPFHSPFTNEIHLTVAHHDKDPAEGWHIDIKRHGFA